MKKWIHYITIAGFIFCFGYFGFETLTKKPNTYSDVEQRELSSMPDFSLKSFVNGQFSSLFQTFFDDQFHKRIGITKTFFTLQQQVGKKSINGTLIGDKGYLTYLYKVNSTTSKLAKDAIIQVNDVSAFAKKENIPLYFILNPSKTTALDHLFAKRISEIDTIGIRERLLANLNPYITLINNVDYFEQKVTDEEREDLYLKTDHHWNYKGAYLGYQHLFEVLHADHPEIPKALTPQELKLACPTQPDAVFSGSDNRHLLNLIENPLEQSCTYDVQDRSVFKDFYFYNTDYSYSEEMSKLLKKGINSNMVSYGWMTTSDVPEIMFKMKNPPNDLNVLIVKDSYMNAMVPFIATHFNETRILDFRFFKESSLQEYAQKHKVDLIILAHFEKALYGPAMTYSK